ncbi:MAG: type I DNA topoisomerase [bacterium]
MKLVIVESPTKAKTLKKFLKADYVVLPSYGHIADLPKSELGVDLENQYEPSYVITPNGKKALPAIKRGAKEAEAVYLAVDPDREGEAIAFSLLKRLPRGVKNVKRVVFHEITKEAVAEAFAKPGELDINLVEAQQARRVLDRLVGYKLSPLLWKKIRYGLSAGRVQSVAVRLIVERQAEIDIFKPEEYWTIEADFLHKKEILKAELSWKIPIPTGKPARALCSEIEACKKWHIASIKEQERERRPYPPFKTSTLQQAAAANFGWSAKRTMQIAQKLYEQGLITYMRTDSTNLSHRFLDDAKTFLKGKGLSLEKPRFFSKKSKGAQEAHEAIRPTKASNSPDLAKLSQADEAKLYRLIWERSLASQAKPALIKTKTVLIKDADGSFTFKVCGSSLVSQGWLGLIGKRKVSELVDGLIPAGIKEGQEVNLAQVTPLQHFTSPPPYFNEASLVKELESLGVGRPSTYAVIIDTILRRGYVELDNRKLTPTDSGVVVTKFLKQYFPNIVDYDFTAAMEKNLDTIAEGALSWVKVVDDFYKPFEKELILKEKTVKKDDLVILEKLTRQCPECGKVLIVKLGRFGKFVSCSNYPSCKYAETIEGEKKLPEDAGQFEGRCPECGGGLKLKNGPFGRFVGCANYPKCKYTKPYLEKIGMACPQCKRGEVVAKKGRGKRLFYGCSRYPECRYVSSKNPRHS